MGNQLRLIREEFSELCDALMREKRKDILKEAIDLDVVVTGLLLMLHITPEAIAAAEVRVCENNLAKVENGTLDDHMKLVKPKNHPKVDLSDLI